MKIGIVGVGAIGGSLARFILEENIGVLHGLCDIHPEKISSLPVQHLLVNELVAQCDLIIEAASKDIIPELLKKVIDQEKSIMIMSVGGLLEAQDLLDEAREKSINIYVPTGAIAGVDALHAATQAGLKSVTLTTTKSPQSLGIETTEKKTVFEGSAKEAIEHFPKNVNVSSLLSLVGLGPIRTKVKIVCDPAASNNVHEIVVESSAGRVRSIVENVPSENPKTSALAIYSAKATLKKIFDTVKFGT